MSHIKGTDERTIARLVKAYGATNVVAEAQEQAGKRVRHNPRKQSVAKRYRRKRARIARRIPRRRKRNPVVGILTANPGRIVRCLSTRVEELRYQHKQDGRWYKHRFETGVRLELLNDGSLWLRHPSKPLWEKFA